MAEETKFDEVGARYMVDGKLVDANGNELKEPKKPAKKEAAKEAE